MKRLATDLDLQIPDLRLEPRHDARPDCREPLSCRAKTPGKHCSACSLAAKWKDPAFRAKRAEAFRQKLADPDFKAEHCRKSAERLAKWRAEPQNRPGMHENSLANLAIANSPEGIERRRRIVREQRLGWCPEHRREEYRHLSRQMPAAEARRIIMADELAKARRTVAHAPQSLSFEQQLERVRNGAGVVEKFQPRSRDYDFTLGGNATGML